MRLVQYSEKAFDQVATSPTSNVKLMGPYIMTWLHNYLASSRQSVVVNGTSESSHAISGVLQGSILGPLLFLIYIDDITNGPFSPGTCIVLYADDILLCRIVLYADDILLYRTISSILDYSYLQSDANTVQD